MYLSPPIAQKCEIFHTNTGIGGDYCFTIIIFALLKKNNYFCIIKKE